MKNILIAILKTIVIMIAILTSLFLLLAFPKTMCLSIVSFGVFLMVCQTEKYKD